MTWLKPKLNNPYLKIELLMNRLYLMAFVLLSLVSLQVRAQYLGKSPMRRPLKYEKPTYTTQSTTGLEEKRGNNTWNVWIDREGVTTSSGQRPVFLDKFFVVEEKEDQVHIVKDDDSYNIVTNTFIKEPVDFGWVDKKLLILWKTALYDEKTKFRIKILTITDPSVMSKRLEEIRNGSKMLAFYNSPVTRTTNSNETSLFQVFYVFKQESGRYLISKVVDLQNASAGYFILGWVDKSMVQAWGQRQTLEPNKNVEAAGERKRNNIRTSVFANKSDADNYLKEGSGTTAFWNDDKYADPINPYWKRLPILSKDGNIVETAVVSDLVQEDGKKVDDDIFNNISRMYNEQRERSRKINLVFVVDGTRSMAPYLQSVRKAVLTSAQKLKQSENEFKFSAVIYRDYKSKDDDACYEILPLTNYEAFYTFVSKVTTDDPACDDNTDSEGLYKGLLKVRSILRGKEKQTNVIILVGDAGDRIASDRIGEADVLPVLTEFGVSLLTVQVHHNAKKDYEDFIFQTRDLSLKSASRIVDLQRQTYGELNLTSLNTRPRWQQDTKGNRTLFTLKQGPVGGGLQYAAEGQSISPQVVEAEIERIIDDISDKNDKMLNELGKLMEGIITPDVSKIGAFSTEAIQLLMKAGFRPEDIRILMQRNYQFLLRGYTSIQTSKVNSPLYNFTLFMDNDEFDALKIALDKLYIPGQTSTARRERFRESWLQILKANYGVKTEEIEDKTLAELTALITGLPSVNPILKKYTVNDITDITRLPNNELEQICNLIKEKRDRITRDGGDKAYYFLSNDNAYYWIPQSHLP